MMKTYRYILIALFLFRIHTDLFAHQHPDKIMPIPQAIALSAQAAPNGIKGIFKFNVKNTGRTSTQIYLNSEKNYRSNTNITIVFTKPAILEFRKKYGKDPDEYFYRKMIVISGIAKQIKINFVKSDKYYYQTHIQVSSLSQIMNL